MGFLGVKSVHLNKKIFDRWMKEVIEDDYSNEEDFFKDFSNQTQSYELFLTRLGIYLPKTKLQIKTIPPDFLLRCGKWNQNLLKGNDACCTKEKPCGVHEGDCDEDVDCKGFLICKDNNCPWKSDRDDCCEYPIQLHVD